MWDVTFYLDHFCLARLARHIHHSVPIVVGRLQVRPTLQQELDNRRVPELRRDVQRALAGLQRTWGSYHN